MRARVASVAICSIYIAACSGAPAISPEEMDRRLRAESDGWPELADASYQRKLARFLDDSALYESDPDSFFPVSSTTLPCSLDREYMEQILFRKTMAQKRSEVSSKAEYRSSAPTVLEGDCSTGKLSGPAQISGSYQVHHDQPLLATTVSLRGTFQDGRLAGEYSLYQKDESVRPERTTIGFGYGAEREGSLTEALVLFSVEQDGYVHSTRVEEQMDPEVRRITKYLGRNLVEEYYERNGVLHGMFRRYARPLAGVSGNMVCYMNGQIRKDATCDGPTVQIASKPVEPNLPSGDLSDRVAGSRDAKKAALLKDRRMKSAPDNIADATPSGDAIAAKKAQIPKGGIGIGRKSSSKKSNAAWPELDQALRRVGGGEKDAAVIVGTEDYAYVADVPGARKNAKDWYRYFVKVRGTNPGNVKLLLDEQATDVGMKSAMKSAAQQVKTGGTIWFVYIGHGAPSADQKDGLLVGVDAQQSAEGLYGRSVAQADLIDLASAGKQQRTVLVVDACFSGRTGDGSALASGLQPLLPVKQQVSDKRTLVFSAATSSQFAGPLPKLGRPAFSYLMLGGLLGWSDRNGDGNITSTELMRYSQDTLRAVLNDRNQTPELHPNRDEKLGKSAGRTAPDVAEIVLGN